MKQGYRFLTALVPLAILIVFSAVLLALPGCDKKTGDEEAQDQAGDGRVGVLIVLKGRAIVFRGDRTITVRRRYFFGTRRPGAHRAESQGAGDLFRSLERIGLYRHQENRIRGSGRRLVRRLDLPSVFLSHRLRPVDQRP